MLRTSGDVSIVARLTSALESYAPHERRCFLKVYSIYDEEVICSARAEMFLRP